MLSKKYYRIFAELLRTSNNLDDFKSVFVDFLAMDNKRFDRTKFAKASEKKEFPYITEALETVCRSR
jgi:hypothetical protein